MTTETKEVQKMTLEEYKKKVEENLKKVVSEKYDWQVMRDYEEEFPTFLKEGWSIEGLTPAIINYLI